MNNEKPATAPSATPAKCRVCSDEIKEGENGDNRCFFCFMNHRGETPTPTAPGAG